jgi:hypothetical protein
VISKAKIAFINSKNADFSEISIGLGYSTPVGLQHFEIITVINYPYEKIFNLGIRKRNSTASAYGNQKNPIGIYYLPAGK